MDTKPKRLYIQAVFLILFLIIQYAFGMAANLFVQFPENASAGKLWEYAWSQTLTSAHIIIGILLVLGALVFVVRAIRSSSRAWIVPSITGLLAIIAAGASGSLFIATQNGLYSYGMSLAFLVALIAYGWGLVYRYK